MTPETWRKVSMALAQVLDPRNQGDRRLYGLLRRTQKASQVRQAS
jgi:hypothetical protein